MASSSKENDDEKLKRQVDILQKQVDNLNKTVATQTANQTNQTNSKNTQTTTVSIKEMVFGPVALILYYLISIGVFLGGLIGFLDDSISLGVAITLTIVGVALLALTIIFTIYRRRRKRRNRALAKRAYVAKIYGVDTNDVTDEMVEAYIHKLDKQIEDLKVTVEIEHQEAVEMMKEDLDKYK